MLFILVVSAGAGQYVTSGFSNVSDSINILIKGDSIILANRDIIFLQLLKDKKLTENSNSSYSAEVISFPDNNFSFFWSEFNGLTHSSYRKEIIIGETDLNTLPIKTLYSSSVSELTFLNAASGVKSDSYIATFSITDTVYECTDNNSLCIYSKPNNSICHFSGDTFCIVYKIGNSTLAMRQLKLSSGEVSFIDNGTTIGTNTLGAEGNFSNSSVARDSSGNILVIITRGGVLWQKKLEYHLTDINYKDNAIGDIANNVSNEIGSVLYSDASVVSYTDKKFAVVYWKSDGIYLCTLSVSGEPPAVSSIVSSKIVDGNTFRAATMASQGKNMLIVWKNYATGKIEAKRLTVVNGTISDIPSETVVLSHSSTVVDTAAPELNAVLDTNGNIAVAWTNGSDAIGSIWANIGVRYSSGFWISAVESVAVIPGDSLLFIPGSFNASLNNGNISVSLQTGPTTGISSGWSPWSSIASEIELEQNTKGKCRYYRYKADFTRSLTDSIKTPVLNEITVNWNLKPRFSSLDSVKVNGNIIPGISGFGDTVDVVSEYDTLDCYFTVHDGDIGDTIYLAALWDIQPENTCDTLIGDADIGGHVILMPSDVWDTLYTCTFTGNDSRLWDAETRDIFIRARKPAPVITSVTVDGHNVLDSHSVSIAIGVPTNIDVDIERSKIVDWNIIEYSFISKRFDTSFTTSSQLIFSPSKNDTSLTVIAKDMFNAADTFFLYFTYPEFCVDTVKNPGFTNAKKKLADNLSFIIGGYSADTIIMPIKNSGNDTLVIDSIFFSVDTSQWLRLGVVQGLYTIFFDSLTSTSNIIPVNLLPDSGTSIYFDINADNLSGDSVLFDTVFIWTNDPVYPVDSVPICIEYNQFPYITSVAVEFEPGTPYWLAKRLNSEKLSGYRFPPHAKVSVTFSEPMDPDSALEKIHGYSIFDSASTGVIDTIYFQQSWLDNYTKLHLRPTYSSPSTYFGGLIPPEGTFIPTDSIAVSISSDLTDRANTPDGPNHLDINGDFIEDFGVDTIVTLRVDSIEFKLENVSPAPASTDIHTDTSVILTFSSPIFPGTIDTSRVNNRSLIILTRHNSIYDSLKQVVFDDIIISGNIVTFVPSKTFFYGDSVHCYYRGVTGRDTLGYPVDMNNDGIPIGFLDSASEADDYSWSFIVNDIECDSVLPKNRAGDVQLNTPITLIFSEQLIPGIIDTARIGNRSLTVTSRYSERTRIDFDTVIVNNNIAVFHLNRALFYADSVFCDFSGLITKDTSAFSVDMGQDTVYTTNEGRSWFFVVKKLSVESVNPDSASTNADIHDPIRINFSGPISSAIFDTTADADSNKSFFFTSIFSSMGRMPIKRIEFSSDSSGVIIFPEAAYFSNDSIYCEFAGFNRGYSYVSTKRLIPTDTGEVTSSYSWYFFTGKIGFYTYPNPYKPGSNPRHKRLGGIWFKNFHKLKTNTNSVVIKIFNINTHPVFESEPIRFESGNSEMRPQWFWNVKNTRGSDIASGVYFYAIYDQKNRVLMKDKILIVR